ncbi:hypothetical protein BT63DRAFT_456334 [Microthyrium microscopicum]|uniref:Uncharacterized protein n=1 Tax=Microthyrium microscopicum TaxID=703497 RepID=A0A6A6UCP5_9PEZI|nr:hypothetical protein BT63DRAFT_456334 [Microthyrium microscopicum]
MNTGQSGLYFTMREDAGSQRNSRFARLSTIQGGMRSALRNPFHFSTASSLYSRSPNPNNNPNANANGPGTPKINFGGFFGRREDGPSGSGNDDNLNIPLHSNPEPLGRTYPYSPANQPTGWGRGQPEVILDPEPAFLRPQQSREPLVGSTTDSTQSTEATEPSGGPDRERRRRRKHKRRHHHRQEGWVRPHRRGTGSSRRTNSLHHQSQREENIYISSVVSGLFLIATIITYVAIVLSVKGLGEELHILFAITIAGALVFLIHSLIRMRTARKRQRSLQRARARVNGTPTGGFMPTEPIRVHMVHDEELAEPEMREKVVPAKPVPPAYGVWRSSVKVDPGLLFWQRVDRPGGSSTNLPTATASGAPRPPSYLSDDGVSYVAEAQPRSTVYMQRPPSDLHPAFRGVAR